MDLKRDTILVCASLAIIETVFTLAYKYDSELKILFIMFCETYFKLPNDFVI